MGVCFNSSLTTIVAFAAALVAMVGCQRYEPQPLTPTVVDDRIKAPAANALQASAFTIAHQHLPPAGLQFEDGLTPDDAAVVAVLANQQLRATRDQRGSAAATLLQAGLLPNPVLTYSSDFVTGGFTAGTFNAYGATLSWDFEQLISRSAKVRAAELSAASVDLSVMWAEWQTAEAAKLAVLDLISLQAQLAVLNDIDGRLQENFATVRRAAAAGLQTGVDLAAAEAAARDARAAVLEAQREVDHQWLQLTRAMGFPSDQHPKLRPRLALASTCAVPDPATLVAGLEQRRIDLLALRRGYESQEQTLRAAVLDQFPKINLGFNDASDNTNVHSVGVVATIDLPIFDRNQGVIAAERATRQRLFDEYVSRVFDSRADIAAAVADLRALNAQIADAQAAVPNLQHLVDAYKQALDHGDADVLSYYQAWNNLAQKRLGVLRLQQQLAETRVALELAAGRCLPDSPITQSATQPDTETQR